MFGTTKNQRLHAAVVDIRERAEEYAKSALEEPDGCAGIDAVDFHHLAWLMENKSMALATRFARNMDTSAREAIPILAWEFLNLVPLNHYKKIYLHSLENHCKTLLFRIESGL